MTMILIGGSFLMMGWSALFLIVLGIVESSFLLNVVAYILTFSGLVVGIIGSILKRTS